MNKKLKILIAFTALLALLAAATLISGISGREERKSGEEQNRKQDEAHAPEDGPEDIFDTEDINNTVIFGGESWEPDRDLTSVLLLGIDRDAEALSNDIIGRNGRADTVLLLVLNKASKSSKLIEISRDTMIGVDIYNDDREYLYSAEMQIDMQYSYSDSAARGCHLMKEKVSELLYGTRIDSCASISITGAKKIVDSMGGITVKMSQDCTQIDPSYVKGAEILMDGGKFERFVRSRFVSDTGSNDDRMTRQRDAVKAFSDLVAGQPASRITELAEAAGNELYSDIPADVLQMIAEYGQPKEIVRIPGKTVEGERHDEYRVDEDALKEFIIKNFYKKTNQ